MRIANINGTSDDTCACGSWLAHWRKFSGQATGYCTVPGCLNKDLVGAHVQKALGWDANWYIVPLCNFHNQSKEELDVNDNFKLVPANRKETCEK